MERMNSQKDWLDYVNRLQERERQKIISTGLTNWMLLLGLMALAYWIYPDITNIQQNYLTVLLGYIVFTNISVTIFDVFNANFRQEKIKKIFEPITIIDKKAFRLLNTHQLLMLVVGIGLNSYFVYLSIQNSRIVFCIYFILYFIRNIAPFFANLLKKLAQNPESIYIIFLHLIIKLILHEFTKIIFTILLICYVFTHYDFNNILWKQLLDGLALAIIFVLLQFLLMIFIKRMKIAWLESFEKEIILNSLNQDEIVRKLKNNYFHGSNIDDYF